MEALKRGELRLEDIVEVKESVGRELGEYQGELLYLKKGKFGLYVEWGKEKRSLKSLENVSECDITYELVMNTILAVNKSIIREITKDMTIRNGKYGAYIYYKAENMKTVSYTHLRAHETR